MGEQKLEVVAHNLNNLTELPVSLVSFNEALQGYQVLPGLGFACGEQNPLN